MGGEKSRSNPVTNFLAGGVGGVFVVVSGQPLDTVKVRIQTAPVPKPGEAPAFTGMLDCFRKTIGKEGFFAIYKGMGAPLVGVAPLYALFFLGGSIGRRLQQKDPSDKLSVLQHFNSGLFAGVMITVITVPVERIKCVLQVQRNAVGSGNAMYAGPIDCTKQLYLEGGMRSVYRGTCATMLRDVPASGLFFGTYELVMRWCVGEDRTKLNPVITLGAGGMAGLANWGWAIMPDVLKSRLQTAPEGKYPNGIRDVFRDMLKHEGPKSLFKGFVPIMLRGAIANAFAFLGYELSMKVFNIFGF